MSALNRFCDRALLLERGVPVLVGEAHEIGDRYLEINFGRQAETAGEGETRSGDGDARIVEAWIEDSSGERRPSVHQHQQVTIRALVRFDVDVEDPVASVYLLNEEHVAIVVATTAREHERSGRFSAGEEAELAFSFENVLAPGRYNPLFELAHRGTGLDLMDRVDGAFSFMVTGVTPGGGLVDPPVDVGIARRSPAERPVSA
jgi:hypothetical protein